MSQKKQHYQGILTVRHQVLPLGQQNSCPVPWLPGAEVDPIPCSWQFWAKGDSAIANLNTLLASSMDELLTME